MNGTELPIEAPRKKRTWLWIVFGVFFVLFVLAAAGIIFSVAFFRQSMSIAPMNAERATQEFDAIRARYPGQQPLIRMIDGRPELVADRATPTGAPAALTSVHMMAWDDDEGQLVTFTLPFWLLRLKSGPIRFSSYTEGWDDRGFSIRIEDLERAGPGIVVDASERDGRVLIWAQ